ncbi:MAG: efflux RND transporter periplasmic adaptor subunit, partial [Phycisphaerales bacterium]
RIALPGAILLIASGLLVTAASDAFRPATMVRVVPVIVKTDVEAQPPGGVVLQAPGWVEADPFPTAVSALADGVVEEVLVLEGERIQAGQVVARLVAQDARIALEQADAELAERHADLAIARAALEEAQRNWEHPIELSRQKQTAEAHLAEMRAELARWPSELAREEARSLYLTADYERIAPLQKNGQASDIELIQARQAHQAQQAEVDAVRGRKPILEARVWALEAEVRAVTDNLRLRIKDTRALAEAKAAVQRAEAAIAVARARRDEAALRLERMHVRSPAGGVVMARLVEPGSKVMLNMDHPRSAQVVRLYDPNRLQVRVDIPLVDAAKVGVGQPAEVIVEVLPDKVFHGQVTRVVHEADVQKNTLQVKVAIEDPAPEIKPEMLGRARFLAVADSSTVDGRESNLRLFVPKSTVFERAGRSFVWLADHVEEVARLRAIKPGRLTLDDWMAVAEGLRPGDRVIIDAPADLEDGQRILPVEP